MLQPGTQVGRYEIQRRLGRGGMGTVYVARDPVLGRMVAIKVFLSDLEMADAAERFSREARSAAALNHANIVTVHDFGDVSLQPYIVMEYVEGDTLGDIIKRKAPIAAIDKLRWIEELCSGVAYAHQHNVIHRDIKPTNLMIDRSGRVKILDFGIAKMLGTLGTNATALIGTPGYMAPEQILGGAVDGRADLFSVGVVCYELLAYTEAFPGDTIPAITHRIVSEEPIPLAHFVPDLHPELAAVVDRALKKSPADRFADAEEFRLAVSKIRRQLESTTDWEQTMITRPRPPSVKDGGANRIGTGSARKQSGDLVGVAELTPPPDPKKTDREALRRRRTAQIAAALELARSNFDKGLLDEALDACQQALTLDDTSADALELEPRIQAAIGKQRAGVLLTNARTELQKGALTTALDLLQQARALDPEAYEAKRVERDLRLARVEQERVRQRADAANKALVAARGAFDRGDVEGALAGARQALELDPDLRAASTLEAEAIRRLYAEVDLNPNDSVIAVAPPEQTIVALPKRKATSTPGKPGVPKLKAPSLTRKQLVVAGGAAAVVALVIAAVMWMPKPSSSAPRGTLVIDAVPWAYITSIEGQDGSSATVPTPASTPVAMQLPAGQYTIRLAGPPPESELRVITATVQADGVITTPIERFAAMTPEEYFRQYLAAPAPAEEKPAGSTQ